MNAVYLDVSELAPPEPMTKIISALAQLLPLQCLVIKHRRQPFPLYEKLTAAGWTYHCVEITADEYALFIYKASEQPHFVTFYPAFQQASFTPFFTSYLPPL